MFRLLIVDDEELITDGLYDVFSRLLPGELDVYKAYSGKEALEWMNRTRIDIILTDISMPGISGLELVEQVQELWPRCKVIFLTGYDYFDYVYQAIQMKDVRYLLKTEGYDKVIETVKELIAELKNDTLEDQTIELTAEEKFTYKLLEQSDFMHHILQNSKTACDDLERLAKDFEDLDIPLQTSEPVYVILGRWEYPEDKSYAERGRILNYVRVIWNRQFGAQIKSSSIVDRYGDVVWLIQMKSNKQKNQERFIDFIEGTLEVIQEYCLNALELNVQFTMSNNMIEWPLVSKKYRQLRQLQQLKIDTDFPLIIKENDQDEIQDRQGLNLTPKIDILSAHVAANRPTAFFDVFSEMIQIVEVGTYEEMLELYFVVALVLFADIRHNAFENRINEFNKLLKIDEHASLKIGFNYLEQIAKQVFELKKTDGQDRTTKVIDRVVHYIEHHLHEDLSLVRLADLYYFNPSYLSHLFKQEQGVNLSEYIDQARVKRAKKLFRETDLKVREVSEQLNYHSAHSFTRFFKKMTGSTPKEYRESLSQND